MKERGNLAKRFKRRAMASDNGIYIITGLARPLGAASAVTSATGFGEPVGIPLGAIAGVLGLSTIPIRRIGKVLYIKFAKNEKIKTLAESKLDSISDLVSKAVEEANVSHEEKEHYRKMKEEIHVKSKKVADKFTAEQSEDILKHGREEGKQAFFSLNSRFFRYPKYQCQGGSLHLDTSCKDQYNFIFIMPTNNNL